MNFMEKTEELKSISKEVHNVLVTNGYINSVKVYCELNFFKEDYNVSEEPVDIYVVYSEEKPSDDIVRTLDSMYTYYSVKVMEQSKFVNNYRSNCTLVYEV